MGLFTFLHGVGKMLVPGRWHPITICFVYLVYMHRVVLVPSARIFLVLGSSYKINGQTVERS